AIDTDQPRHRYQRGELARVWWELVPVDGKRVLTKPRIALAERLHIEMDLVGRGWTYDQVPPPGTRQFHMGVPFHTGCIVIAHRRLLLFARNAPGGISGVARLSRR